MEKLAHFNRERIPERVVHAKGWGAHGVFTVTEDISRYTKADIFGADTVKRNIDDGNLENAQDNLAYIRQNFLSCDVDRLEEKLQMLLDDAQEGEELLSESTLKKMRDSKLDSDDDDDD